MTNTRALPGTQPGRSTTCCTRLTRLGERCASLWAPEVQLGGPHVTDAAPRARLETLRAVRLKIGASSAASDWIRSDVAIEVEPSAWN
jgi:hypothetical protein